MQLLSTGLFEKYGFNRLHVAGHPEGNSDIDSIGGTQNVTVPSNGNRIIQEIPKQILRLATQFFFEAKPVISWAEKLFLDGISLPVNIGIAGPAKLQTMIKFALACGVGPSIRVLERRAKDLTKLLFPFEPTDILNELGRLSSENKKMNLKSIHFFPLEE